METIGLFYNEKLDVLIGISAGNYLAGTKKIKIAEENLVVFLDNQNNITNFNLFFPKKYLPCKLKNGINSDNVEIRRAVKKLFYHFNLNLPTNDDMCFVVGKITKTKSHQNSEKLTICEVDVDSQCLQIVCGAKNCVVNSLVVVAQEGTIMPSGKMIIPSELLGVASQGMLCSERELGLQDNNEKKEIMVLQSKKYLIGKSFWGQFYEE